MSTPVQPEVTPINGEPTRFFVASDSRAEPHLVDLSEFDLTGACGCEQFQFRLQPKLESGERDRSGGDKHRCKHIIKARQYFCDLALKDLNKIH